MNVSQACLRQHIGSEDAAGATGAVNDDRLLACLSVEAGLERPWHDLAAGDVDGAGNMPLFILAFRARIENEDAFLDQTSQLLRIHLMYLVGHRKCLSEGLAQDIDSIRRFTTSR